MWVLGTAPDPLQEQPILLTIEPSLHSQNQGLKKTKCVHAYVCICFYAHRCTCAIAYVWRSEDNSRESLLFYHLVGLNSGQIVRPACRYPLNSLPTHKNHVKHGGQRTTCGVEFSLHHVEVILFRFTAGTFTHGANSVVFNQSTI